MRAPRAPLAGAVAVGLAAALLVVGCGGPETARPRTPPRGATAPVDRLGLRRQVGQLLIVSFHGGRAPAYIERILRDGAAGGVVLFGENITGPAQLRALTATLQRAGGRSVLVAADQEGGAVRIVPFAGPATGQASVASPAQAGADARAAARDLRRLGVDVALAPVADVAADDGSALRGRAYPGGAAAVAARVRAAVRGAAAGGVAATAKHFPGLGGAADSTDRTPVTIVRPAAALRTVDLAPFRAAIAAGVPLVMASHALYPALDERRIASQSPAILRGLLRRELGFRGAVVTDSIEARAVIRRSDVGTAALRSVAAGADLVLMTGPGSFRPVFRRLLARARRSPAFRARVRAAAARVLALKRDLGLSMPTGKV